MLRWRPWRATCWVQVRSKQGEHRPDPFAHYGFDPLSEIDRCLDRALRSIQAAAISSIECTAVTGIHVCTASMIPVWYSTYRCGRDSTKTVTGQFTRLFGDVPTRDPELLASRLAAIQHDDSAMIAGSDRLTLNLG